MALTGHTGWTGGSLWVDPFSQSFVIFLSNRNHPDENGSVNALRAKLGTLAAEAITDFDFDHVPVVLNGINVLVKQGFRPSRPAPGTGHPVASRASPQHHH